MNTKTLDALDGNTDSAANALIASDTVLIHTANSTYRFSLIDSSRGFGILTGGVLGTRVARATLIGLATGRGETNEGSIDKLCAGARAIFLIGSSNAVRRVETSLITRVGRTRVDDGARRSAETTLPLNLPVD